MAKLDRLLNLVAALIDTTVPLTADDIPVALGDLIDLASSQAAALAP